MRTDHLRLDPRRDDLRRALRAADAAQRDAMPRFREALKRFFSPDDGAVHAVDRDTRTVLLGAPVPARRAFLRSSGLAVVGAVALVACSDDGGDGEGDGGTTTTATGTGGAPTGPTAGDIDLAIAAIQIENTAVAAYDAMAAARSIDLQAAGLTEAVQLFRDHHDEHRGALNDLLDDHGRSAIPEDERFAGIILPTGDEIASLPVGELVAFARGLEDQAAQTYITMVPRLSLPSLRPTLLAIGSVEARHVGAFDLLLGGADEYATTAQLMVGGNYPIRDSFLNG